jgi:hypothetical protein
LTEVSQPASDLCVAHTQNKRRLLTVDRIRYTLSIFSFPILQLLSLLLRYQATQSVFH